MLYEDWHSRWKSFLGRKKDEMGNLRTIERTAIYNSDWDGSSVLAQLEQKGVPPSSVAKVLVRLAHKRIPAERVWGSLVIIYKLLEGRKGSPSAR